MKVLQVLTSIQWGVIITKNKSRFDYPWHSAVISKKTSLAKTKDILELFTISFERNVKRDLREFYKGYDDIDDLVETRYKDILDGWEMYENTDKDASLLTDISNTSDEFRQVEHDVFLGVIGDIEGHNVAELEKFYNPFSLGDINNFYSKTYSKELFSVIPCQENIKKFQSIFKEVLSKGKRCVLAISSDIFEVLFLSIDPCGDKELSSDTVINHLLPEDTFYLPKWIDIIVYDQIKSSSNSSCCTCCQ